MSSLFKWARPRRLAAGTATGALVAVTLLGAVTPAEAVVRTPTWGTVTDLGDTYAGNDPMVFMAADGSHAVVVAVGDDLGAAYWADGGSWSAAAAIGSTHDIAEWSAAASIDAQTVAVAYVEDYGDYAEYVLVSTDGGATWEAETKLSTQTGCEVDDEIPAVSVSPNGNVIAVAYNYDNCTNDVVVRVSTDGGQTWESEEILPQKVAVVDPKVQVQDDGRAVAVWRDNYADVLVATRSAAGVWSSAASVDDPTSTLELFEPRMDVSPDGSTVVASWAERSGSDPTLFYVRKGQWSGNSITWSSAVEIMAGTTNLTGQYSANPQDVQTSIKGETIAVLLEAQPTSGASSATYVAASADGGQTFTLSPAMDPEGYYAKMAMSDAGEVIHASWGSPNNDRKSYTITSVDAGQTWSTKTQLSTSDGADPAIATDSSGSKLVGVWKKNGSPYTLNVSRGTVDVPAPPSAPRTATATNVGGTVTVTWTAPSSGGAVTINNYYIVVVGGGSCTVNASTFTCVVSSLNANITYTVIIYVQSQNGWSAPQFVKAAKATVPGKPRTPAAVAGSGKATVSWTAPASDGGAPVLTYLVTSTPGNKTCTATAPALTCEVKSLTNGTSYTFAIKASNRVGSGAAANTSAVTPVAPAAPSEPRDLVGKGADKSIVVTWRRPASAGTQPITEYTVTARPGGKSCSVTPSAGETTFTCTITGLVNGDDYNLSATAKNSVGVSPKATDGPVSPATVPGKVRDLAIDSVTAQGVALSWKIPLDNGGAKVTGYRVRYQPENAASDIFTFYADVTTTSVVVKGLGKGRWFFSVRALNVAGPSIPVVTLRAARVQ